MNRRQRRAERDGGGSPAGHVCDFLDAGLKDCGESAIGSVYVAPPGYVARRFWWCAEHEVDLQVELLAAGWYVDGWHRR